MTNFQIYRKTLPFAFLRLLFSFLGLLVAVLLPVAAFFITKNMPEKTMVIICGIVTVIGLLGFILLARYLGYLLQAGQIAMITRGVVDGSLPDNVVEEGKAAVKKRFVTANVYFGLQSLIRGITSQITNGVTSATTALGSLGGEDGESVLGAIGGVISAFIAIVLEYVNYCCLGWVFHNSDQNAFKSTCDGAVVYFQNWKVLLKNAGKVFGITLLSLVVIGAPLAYLAYTILNATHGVSSLVAAVAEATQLDAATSLIVIAVVLGLIAWAIIHSALVKPYILVSVLRKYMEAAEANPPKLDVYGKLCKLSKRFTTAMEKADMKVPVINETGL